MRFHSADPRVVRGEVRGLLQVVPVIPGEDRDILGVTASFHVISRVSGVSA